MFFAMTLSGSVDFFVSESVEILVVGMGFKRLVRKPLLVLGFNFHLLVDRSFFLLDFRQHIAVDDSLLGHFNLVDL